jgi:polysaccharide export outer membrane protein
MKTMTKTAIILAFSLCGGATAQQAQTVQPVRTAPEPKLIAPTGLPPAPTGLAPAETASTTQHGERRDRGYVLGPGDQVIVHAMNVDEITDKPLTVDLDGTIRLPVVGRVQAAGLTTPQLEGQIAERLRTYLLHPDVSVSIAEFRSQPVSVIGAVKNPGVQQVQGRKTVVEMLSMAGGLDPAAGSTVKITRLLERGRIPLPNAKDDPTGQFSVAEINLKSIMDAKNPEENILVEPFDVISVPRADTVYVIGEVPKAGGFVLNDHEEITVLQALSMAGGMNNTAKPSESRILRRMPGQESRTEIPINLKKILEGKGKDVPMQAEDILFIPNSVPKRAALRAAEAAVQMATGVVIWGRY